MSRRVSTRSRFLVCESRDVFSYGFLATSISCNTSQMADTYRVFRLQRPVKYRLVASGVGDPPQALLIAYAVSPSLSARAETASRIESSLSIGGRYDRFDSRHATQ
jgi:hypothetical protein